MHGEGGEDSYKNLPNSMNTSVFLTSLNSTASPSRWLRVFLVPPVEHICEVPHLGSHNRFHLKVNKRTKTLHFPEVDECATSEQNFASVRGLGRVNHVTNEAVICVNAVPDGQVPIILVAVVVMLDVSPSRHSALQARWVPVVARSGQSGDRRCCDGGRGGRSRRHGFRSASSRWVGGDRVVPV